MVRKTVIVSTTADFYSEADAEEFGKAEANSIVDVMNLSEKVRRVEHHVSVSVKVTEPQGV